MISDPNYEQLYAAPGHSHPCIVDVRCRRCSFRCNSRRHYYGHVARLWMENAAKSVSVHVTGAGRSRAGAPGRCSGCRDILLLCMNILLWDKDN